MSLKHGILGLLNYSPMTGYDLSKSFQNSLNHFWQAQTSQIYRELRDMEKLGWIASETVIQTDKPNKNIFSLTG
ncbi:MAG: PadR family transcriptional regulator, partial [Clostridiaceae bacterium]